MSENNINGITGAEVTTTGIIGGTVGIGQYIINDYVITIAETEGEYGYTMTITRGTDTQTVTLYGLTPEQYNAMLGYLEQAQSAAENADAYMEVAINAANTANTQAGRATQASNTAQSYASQAQTAKQGAETAKNDAQTARTQAQGYRQAAEAAATRAETAATNAGNAQTAAEAAQTSAEAAQSAAETAETNAQTYAGQAAQSATEAAQSAASAAQTLAQVQAEGQTQIAAIDAEGQRVIDSIPADYSQMTEDVADLKSQIEEISQSGIDASGASDGQVPVADGQGSWEWDEPAGGVSDVQVNGVSVVSGGVADVPVASASDFGVVRTGAGLYVDPSTNITRVSRPSDAQIKAGADTDTSIAPGKQHASAFYGLAKAAGDSTQPASANAVGQYTENAKSAISEMLNGSVTVTGTTPSITALPGVRYVCGEVSTIDITVPATGIVDIVFTSGATPAVLTVTPPTGVTMKWANGFDPTTLEANTVYEINIMDGVYGVVGMWT